MQPDGAAIIRVLLVSPPEGVCAAISGNLMYSVLVAILPTPESHEISLRVMKLFQGAVAWVVCLHRKLAYFSLNIHLSECCGDPDGHCGRRLDRH